MDISDLIGQIPYRLALAGGWIDQPFVSRLNPSPPGAMVVVQVRPTFRFMDRCGMATSTRKIAAQLWNGRLPAGDPAELVRRLYEAENAGRGEPSGSQDMAGLIYPGVNRLDYDAGYQDGFFPVHVQTCTDPAITGWLEQALHILPVAPRPEGYNPLGEKRLGPAWIARLGQCGKDCFDAILNRDITGLGASLNESMRCWEALLPHTVRHPAIQADLPAILAWYQQRYPGAMYSGCGGGYLFIASDEPVPGSFHVQIQSGEQGRP